MKRIGIDFGSKRIGLALSDDSGRMAFPHSVVPNNDSFFKSLEKVIDDNSVQEIVIGHSLDREGNPNSIHSQVEELIQDITLNIGIPVHLEPEQYTSQQAKQIQGKNDMLDASAATLILDSFIQKN